MYKIPKQRCTEEFMQEAVRQVESEGKSPAQVAQELGISETDLVKLAQGDQGRETGLDWWQADHAGAYGTIEVASRERATEDGSRNSGKIDGITSRRCRGERAIPTRWLCCAGFCRSVPVASPWKCCDGPTQWLSDEQLLALIWSIHAEVKGSYGSPRMLEELKARGFPASKGRVRRLMQAHGIRGRHKCRYKATTNSAHQSCLWPAIGWTVSSIRLRQTRSGRWTSPTVRPASVARPYGGEAA